LCAEEGLTGERALDGGEGAEGVAAAGVDDGADAEFDDRQGRVHARVSCHFPEEFGAYLSVPLRRP